MIKNLAVAQLPLTEEENLKDQNISFHACPSYIQYFNKKGNFAVGPHIETIMYQLGEMGNLKQFMHCKYVIEIVLGNI